jgi:hypothetical protein
MYVVNSTAKKTWNINNMSFFPVKYLISVSMVLLCNFLKKVYEFELLSPFGAIKKCQILSDSNLQ